MAALPAVQETGLLMLSPDSLLADPAQLANALLESFRILEPPVVRAAFGLAPLIVFAWACAFAWGRTAVLTRFDLAVPRRPLLLAASEGLRITVLLGSVLAFLGAVRFSAAMAFNGTRTHTLLYVIAVPALAWLQLWFTGRFRRALAIATMACLIEHVPLPRAFGRAWQLDTHHRVIPLRRAVGRIRMYLLLASLALGFVPAPFALGWPLLAWWLLFSLPPLAAADAWQLGAHFAIIRALQEEQSRKLGPWILRS